MLKNRENSNGGYRVSFLGVDGTLNHKEGECVEWELVMEGGEVG